jgi:hypothetical protein
MTISTILLIAVAALLVFIMFRVGRGVREAAHGQAAVSHATTEDESPANARRTAGDDQAEEGAGRTRHGCC